MTALYAIITRATGTTLTAAIYNADHQNHVDNGIPAQLDDYSVNVAQMQSAVSPGGVGSEVLAGSLAGEIERLRFVIKTIHGGAQWYPGQTMLSSATTSAAITGNITLTNADISSIKNVTAAADITLPDISTLSNGQWIRFKSSTEAKVQLLRATTDTIDGDTSYLIPSYATCEVMRSGAGAWILSVKPDVEIGKLYPWAGVGTTPPRGFLFPEGSAKSRATYGGLFARSTLSGVVTMTIATPAVVTWTGIILQNNDPVEFSTTGALPTGVVAGTTYYIKGLVGTSFNLAATPGGANINTTGSQSGVHTALHIPHGRGDGSTTFNIVDVRGRALLGRDALGGTAASRLTNAISGINGDTPGASGGSESKTIATTNLPASGLSIPSLGVNATGAYTGSTGSGGGAALSLISGSLAGDIGTTAGIVSVSGATTTGTTGNMGSGTGLAVVQPGYVIAWILKT